MPRKKKLDPRMKLPLPKPSMQDRVRDAIRKLNDSIATDRKGELADAVHLLAQRAQLADMRAEALQHLTREKEDWREANRHALETIKIIAERLPAHVADGRYT